MQWQIEAKTFMKRKNADEKEMFTFSLLSCVVHVIVNIELCELNLYSDSKISSVSSLSLPRIAVRLSRFLVMKTCRISPLQFIIDWVDRWIGETTNNGIQLNH